MTRWAVLVTALAILVPAGSARAQTVAPSRSSTWLQRRLERGLTDALGGPVTIGSMEVDWTTLAATIGDVSITVPAEGAPPMTATLAEGRVQLAWSGLSGLAVGDIHILEVVARRATFSCSREWIDAWRPSGKKERGSVAIQIDKLVIEDATAEYLDGRQRFRVATRALGFRGDWSSSRRLLVGEVHADATIEAPFFDRPWPASVRGGLRLGGGRLEIFNATGAGPGATAEMAGNVTWGSGASFTAEGRLDTDLALLSPYLVGHLGLAGQAGGPVQIVLTGGVPIRVTMQADTRGLRIGSIETETARADLTVRPGDFDVANLQARAYSGTFGGTLGVRFGHPMELRTDLHGRGADLARLIALTGKQLPLSSTADVTFAIVGEPGRPATWSGGATFDAQPAATAVPGQVPARGRGRVMFTPGRVRVETEPLALSSSSLRLELDSETLPGSPTMRLALAGTTTDASATQRAALSFLDAFGVPRNRWAVEPVQGNGSFRVDVRTALRATAFDLGLDLADGSYAGEPFAAALLDLGSSPSSVEIRRLEMNDGTASLSGRATFDATTGSADDLEVSARGVSILRLLHHAGVLASVDGLTDLDLRGSRVNGEFAAQGNVSARRVMVEREIIDTIDAPLRIEGSVAVLDGLVARGQGFYARARVRYDFVKEEADVEVLSSRLDLASNRTVAESGLIARGTLDATGSMTLTREGPSGLFSVAASNLLLDTGRSGLRELRLGDVQGTAAISPHGLELACRSIPEAAWTFDAFLGFRSSLPLSAVLYFDDLVVGAGGLFGENADLRLKGQVQAEGDLSKARDMEIDGAFDDVAIRIGPRVVRAAEPFPLRLESGLFALGPARFKGEAADVQLAASGSIANGDLAGYLRGTLDLAIVSSLWSDLRGGGPVDVDATLGGTLDSPDLEGNVAVRDGRLRLIGYPQSLESIDAKAQFAGQTLTLSSFRALQGGGEILASGKVDFRGLVPAAFQATFSGANVVAKYPEGFKGTYDGRISLEGTPKRATLSGRIDVVRGLYAKNFDLGLFGGAHRAFDAPAESPLPRNVALDVDIVAPGNVWLRNDVARVEAEGQIHLGGELVRPEVTGRLSLVPGGTVRYRDVDYRIEYGTLDQTDPKRINPYVDFRGRTRVAAYEIGLHVEGTLDKFDYELTSTPPLASQDIISLLVTGKTLDSLSGPGAAAALPGDMAAYYFAGLLSATFGRQIQNSLGIDQLEITPLLLKGASDPTARVTVGKQVSDAVKILFSQDIGTAQKQSYQIAWDATRRVRLIAESDTQSKLGGEMQYARQFGGTPVGQRESVSAGASLDGATTATTVASVRVVLDEGDVRPDVVKISGIKSGENFDRGRMLQGGDRIRSALLKKGFIQANVRAEASPDDPSPGKTSIVYRVAPGPRVAVTIIMSDGKRGRRGMRKAFAAFAKDTPYTTDFWDEASRALLAELQQQGYFAADVTWTASDGPAGRSLRIVVDRGRPVRLHAVRFSGVTAIPQARIDKLMSSLKSRGLAKRLLRPEVLAADLASLRALYREEGYARVRIAEPRVALAATGDSADVDIAVQEGPRFTVDEVTFSETPAATDDELRAWTAVAHGETFSPRRLAEAEQSLRDRLDALGYPDASVESKADFSADTVDVAFELAAGARKTVGEIVIAGNRVTKNRTIARALTFGRDDLVSKQSFVKSQQQLYRTGLFSSVRLTTTPSGEPGSTTQRVTVKVEEAPPLAFGLGVGYDSSDGPRASVLLGYSNLGGRNVALTVQARVSSNENQEVLTVRRRAAFGSTVDALGSVLFEKVRQDAFTESRASASIRLEQRPKARWIRFLRYTVQKVRISDITDNQAAQDEILKNKLSTDVRLADVAVGIVRDTRDDAFLTTRGGYGSIEGSVFAKPLASEASFLKMFVRGSWTVTLKRGIRFASFLRLGAAYPFASTVLVPLSERFFAGGFNTLRGFATDSVGGVTVAGVKLGGQSLLILNEEWHFPIWRSLGAEIFLDVGNVYPTISDFNPTDVRSSAGAGLRLETPIGPIRVEYGWKLDRKENESPGEVIFSIGAVF